MTKLIGTAPNQTPTNADLGRLAYQDAIANGTGTAGQLLQSGGATAAPAWATVSSGAPDVVFPNLASPNNTYTSSGTWSKGSLDDDDYVWIYLCGGGRGGFSNTYPSESNGGAGGGALLVYGQAGLFDGAAYIIGGGGVGSSSSSQNGHVAGYGGSTKITTTSANGSQVFTTIGGGWNDSYATDIPNKVMVSAPSSAIAQSTTGISGRLKTPYDFIIGANSEPTGWAGAVTGAWESYAWFNATRTTGAGMNGIFGGGGGAGRIQYGGNSLVGVAGGSLYAGAGGAFNGDGAVPGGGGGGSNGQAGDGGAGNMRVYHV